MPSKRDALALVRHMLCTMLVDFLMVITLNKSIPRHVNRVIRGFLLVG